MKCKLRLSYHVKLADQKIIQVRLIDIFLLSVMTTLELLVVQSGQKESPFARSVGTLAWPIMINDAAPVFDFLSET